MKVTKNSGKAFENHPPTPDPIRGVVVDYTEPKEKQTKFGPKMKFAIVIQSELKRDDGDHWTHWEHGYTPNIADKSNLAKDLKKILGITELPAEFDMEDIIGKPVRFMIEHKREGENVYSNLSYLSADKSDTPFRGDGKFVRERNREKKDGNSGASYSKIEKQETGPSWFDVKVHVGQFAGHAVADLPSMEAVHNLITHWWPTVESKPSADDKRLIAALREAKAAAEAAAAKREAEAAKATANF